MKKAILTTTRYVFDTSPKENSKASQIKGPDNPTCVFFRKSVAVDTIGSLSKGTSECASVSQ